MIESIKKYMKIGLVHFMAYPETSGGEGPILETLKKTLTDDYFDAIEVAWIKDPQIKKQAIKMFQTSHMTICYGAHPRLLSTGFNINDTDKTIRGKALSSLKEGIDEAYEYNAVGFVFLSGKYREDKKNEAFNILVDSTFELCEYAKSQGNLKIIHEMFDHKIDKKSLIGPADIALEYAKMIAEKYGNFGLLADLSHIPLIGETSEQAIYPIKDYLVHAHLGNCIMSNPNMPRYGDYHPPFGISGGQNDIKQVIDFLQALMNVGFISPENSPVVSFEVRPSKDEDSDVVIANAKRTLNQAWTKL